MSFRPGYVWLKISQTKTNLLLCLNSLVRRMSSYHTNPLKLGVEVFGIDLKENISPETVDKIKEDLWKSRILVFRDQGEIPGERQVEIAKWFGRLDSEPFFKHPKSPSK